MDEKEREWADSVISDLAKEEPYKMQRPILWVEMVEKKPPTLCARVMAWLRKGWR